MWYDDEMQHERSPSSYPDFQSLPHAHVVRPLQLEAMARGAKD